MMLIGWAAFLGSWVMNILFYKFHPSGVEFSLREKLYIHILGKKRFLWGYKDPKGLRQKDTRVKNELNHCFAQSRKRRVVKPSWKN